MSLTIEKIREKHSTVLDQMIETTIQKNNTAIVWGSFHYSNEEVDLIAFDPITGDELDINPTIQRNSTGYMKVLFNCEKFPSKKKVILALKPKINLDQNLPSVSGSEEPTEILDSNPNSSEAEKSFFQRFIHKAQQNRQDRLKQLEERNEAFRESVTNLSALRPEISNLSRVLSIDECDYSRSIGTIEILKNLEEKLDPNKYLYQHFDLIAGCGQGAIISCFVALGRDLSELEEWWVNSWSLAINPQNAANKVKNALVKVFVDSKPGFLRRSAQKKLGELFTDKVTNNPLTFADLKCEVYIPAIDGNRKTLIYSKSTTPNVTIVEGLMDAALDPLFFQSESTIEDFSIFMGAPEKNCDLSLLHKNDGKLCLVSVGAPVRVYDTGKIDGASRNVIAMLKRDQAQALHLMHCEEYRKKCPPGKYIRLECDGKIMDGVKQQSTRSDSILKAKESAKGVVQSALDKLKVFSIPSTVNAKQLEYK